MRSMPPAWLRRHVLFCFLPLQFLLASAWGVSPDVKLADNPLLRCVASAGDVISGLSASTFSSNSAETHIYQTVFSTTDWSGSLKKYALSVDDGATLRVAPDALWDAAAILTGTKLHSPDPQPSARKIFTAHVHDDGSLLTTEFNWHALSDKQRAELSRSPFDGASDRLGPERLAYLRGVRELEQTKKSGVFRKRERIVGDILNSRPVYVGAPARNVFDKGYQKFQEEHRERRAAVYVGANAGMLHAFDAENGRELFAYIPAALFGDLPKLSHPAYTRRAYVDATAVVAEAKISGHWHTVLAAGMGAGAQGVFALDVTQPSDFQRGKGALWEFTDSDDPDIGHVMTAPIIAKFKVGSDNGVPLYRHFVVVNGGLNSYQDDGPGKFNPNAVGALFLLALDKAPSERWRRDVNYFKFTTPNVDATLANGLSAPALTLSQAGAVQLVYAGDLQGNLWRFDFSGLPPWKTARTSDLPLFRATDAGGNGQPLTTPVRPIFAPNEGYLLLFGTGKFMETLDESKAHFRMQSFYAIHDRGLPAYRVTTRSQLAPRILKSDVGDANSIVGDAFSYAVDAPGKRGWYFDFPASDISGERLISNPLTAFGQLFFNSFIPSDAACSKAGGRSYVVDALTGLSRPGEKSGLASDVGMLAAPVLVEIDSRVQSKYSTGKARVEIKYSILNMGRDGVHGGANAANNQVPLHSVDTSVQRLSWRQIFNWQEWRNAIDK